MHRAMDLDNNDQNLATVYTAYLSISVLAFFFLSVTSSHEKVQSPSVFLLITACIFNFEVF